MTQLFNQTLSAVYSTKL